MTVAVYQGENAEEAWRRELAKYSGLRHPNILQLYGTVNSGGVYATIFHDELVPVEEFMDEFRHSVISLVYLYGYFTTELEPNIFSPYAGLLGHVGIFRDSAPLTMTGIAPL
ncbi:hypothetical protein C8R44DRAFT_889987 [Mycena epipterygia]|nr:hypothetical protein C8R44DRAFT_889987 [Mycena epipterygia]